MRLKWWFRVNQNKLYKKYDFDPHGFLIRRAHVTKTFKFLLKNFRYSVIKKLYVQRIALNKYKQRFIKAYKKKKWKWSLDLRWKQRRKRKVAKKILKKWNYKFWDKFKNNYFNKNFSSLKQTKYSSFFFLRAFKRSVDDRFTKGYALKKTLKNSPKKKRNAKVSRASVKAMFKDKRRRLMRRVTWLNVIKYRKKQKAWWLLRITNKKAAFFYGITQLKKFRYINKLNNRSIPLTTFYAHKLECMLNIVLFRLNFFDNIFIVNNFIRIAGIVLVNGKRVLYPFRFIKVGDIVSFHPKYFKRMFNIFYKRSKFNRSFLIKRMRNEKKKFRPSSFKLLKTVKNFINVPKNIEYNYKIMHFVMWRLPYESEFLSLNFKYFNTHVWAFETQLQYN